MSNARNGEAYNEAMACCLQLAEDLEGYAYVLCLWTKDPVLLFSFENSEHVLQCTLGKLLSEDVPEDYRVPDNWFSINMPPYLRRYIKYGKIPRLAVTTADMTNAEVSEALCPPIKPHEAIKAILDARPQDDPPEKVLAHAMTVSLMFAWACLWQGTLIEKGVIPCFPVFTSIRKTPMCATPLDANRLARKLGMTRGTVDNIVSKARSNMERFGGPFEGRLIYPGSKMNDVFCIANKTGRGFRFQLPELTPLS